MGGMPMGGMAGGMGMPINMGQIGAMPGKTNPDLSQAHSWNSVVLQNGKAHPAASNGQSNPVPQAPLNNQFSGPAPYVYRTPQLAHTALQPQSHNVRQAKRQSNYSGGGFQGMQPHFNPAFYQGQTAGGDGWQNPHGNKRPRPE